MNKSKKIEKINSPPNFNVKLQQTFKLAGAVFGIYFFYGCFGYVQELLTSVKYGEKEERFKFTFFLIFSQCIVNAVFAKLVLLATSTKNDKTPKLNYSLPSLTYVFAMFCSNKAILYIDFPTQALAKSCKPIPVLLTSVYLGKKYKWTKYLCVLIICAGISTFVLSKSKVSTDDKSTSLIGAILLLISLALDGFTGPLQEKLIKDHQPSQTHMMLYLNIWASLIMLAGLFITQEIFLAVNFCLNFPNVLPYLALFSITSAFGQIFIYWTVYQFGALTCSTITTTRKFFSILGSTIWFSHPISTGMFFGILMVFLGLSLDAFFSNREKTIQKEKLK